MSPKLSKAVEAIGKLPQARQDELADLLLDAATRAAIDDSIAAGEASFAEYGCKPSAEVFEEVMARQAIAEGLEDIRAGRVTTVERVWKELGLD